MKLLVYGSKSFAELVRDLAGICGHEFVGYIDDYGTGERVVGSFDHAQASYPATGHGMAVGVGYRDLAARARLIERVKSAGYRMPALVHPRAYVRDAQSIAEGTIVMAQAAVERNARVGECSVVWTGAVVSHDSQVGPNCFLSPGCILCGFVQVGKDCFIGAGATIVDHGVVPDGTLIKAGRVYS